MTVPLRKTTTVTIIIYAGSVAAPHSDIYYTDKKAISNDTHAHGCSSIERFDDILAVVGRISLFFVAFQEY